MFLTGNEKEENYVAYRHKICCINDSKYNRGKVEIFLGQ